MEPYPEMTCLVKLNVNSVGWEKALTNMLKNLKGVSSFNINAVQGTSKITGRVHPRSLLNMLAKSGKHAKLYWVQYGDEVQHYNSSTINYGGDYWYGHNGKVYPRHWGSTGSQPYFYRVQPGSVPSSCEDEQCCSVM